ncbi:hypothetical protein HK098_004335 [Nowakowskiella sp. JEL0407]|nr:hypothetical protein HK098_004335 [Nowakowskiella sp. JEL0407]
MAGFEKGIKPLSASELDGSNLRVLIVHTRWNLEIVQPLVDGAISALKSNNVNSITVQNVPGAYELPFAAQTLLENSSKFDVAILIGVLIKGSTMHFEYICDAVSHGIMRVQLDTKIPCVFGVLTCLTDEQAKSRAGVGGESGKEGHNHGIDWGQTAIEMAKLNKKRSK